MLIILGKMKDKRIRGVIFILIIISLTALWSGCATVGPGPGARAVHVTEVFAGAGLFDLIVTAVSLADPDIGEDTIRNMLREINNDPNLVVYWVPSGNQDVTNLSYQTAILNGSVVFTKYALKESATTMKRAARAGMASKTVEEIGEDDEFTLTEEEEAALKAKAEDLSDEERAELKRTFIYLSCASAALVKVPVTSAELLKQTARLIREPERLMANPLAIPSMLVQIVSINDNLRSVGMQAKGLLKNVNANIEVVKAVLQVNREAREAEKEQETSDTIHSQD